MSNNDWELDEEFQSHAFLGNDEAGENQITFEALMELKTIVAGRVMETIRSLPPTVMDNWPDYSFSNVMEHTNYAVDNEPLADEAHLIKTVMTTLFDESFYSRANTKTFLDWMEIEASLKREGKDIFEDFTERDWERWLMIGNIDDVHVIQYLTKHGQGRYGHFVTKAVHEAMYEASDRKDELNALTTDVILVDFTDGNSLTEYVIRTGEFVRSLQPDLTVQQADEMFPMLESIIQNSIPTPNGVNHDFVSALEEAGWTCVVTERDSFGPVCMTVSNGEHHYYI